MKTGDFINWQLADRGQWAQWRYFNS